MACNAPLLTGTNHPTPDEAVPATFCRSRSSRRSSYNPHMTAIQHFSGSAPIPANNLRRLVLLRTTAIGGLTLVVVTTQWLLGLGIPLGLPLSILALMALALSCQSKEPTGGGATSSSAAITAPSASTMDAKEAGCAALKAEFRKTYEAAGRSCQKDSDCTCCPGGIDPAGCGTVMNQKSASELYRIYAKVRKDCGLDRHCAPRLCRAGCRNGGCVELPREEFDQPRLEVK